MNRPDEAIEELSSTIHTARGQSDSLHEMELLSRLGTAYFEKKMIDDACQAWDQALALAVKLKRTNDEARLV